MDDDEKRTRFKETIEFLFLFVATIFITYPIFYDMNDPAKNTIAIPAFFYTIGFGLIFVVVVIIVKSSIKKM